MKSDDMSRSGRSRRKYGEKERVFAARLCREMSVSRDELIHPEESDAAR